MKNLADIRTDYTKETLDTTDVLLSPISQFEKWMQAAINAEVHEPTAMNIATVNKNYNISSRIVLLKGIENDKFVFFTNYKSHKGHDMDEVKTIALNFFWPQLERQIRIEGTIQKISLERSSEYFYSRPIESQIGAWASYQSEILSSREILETRFNTLKNKFGNTVPMPDFWGGYEVDATYFEFWQGRPSRLHDRIAYTLDNNRWKIERLNP
jgi:pyridoxamine 5'-phosphate oxidase